MLHTVSERDYYKLIKEKEDVIEARLDYGYPLVKSIMSQWLPHLHAAEVVILLWLMSRTVLVGRSADRIPYREFVEGVKTDEGVSIGGLPLSLVTIKKHLKTLIAADFLTVYKSGNGVDEAEKEPRMFEINVKKMLNDPALEERNSRLLLDIEGRIELEKTKKRVGRGARTCTPPPQKLGGPSYINYIDSSNRERLGEPNQLQSAGSAAPRVAEENIYMLPVPKRARPKQTYSDSVSEVIGKATAQHLQLQKERVAAAASGELSPKTLQALINQAMTDYHPSLPKTAVTAKTFSVFRRRFNEAQIADVKGFIDYCIREWSLLASQNRAAFLRSTSKRAQGTPLPSAPTFASLAYRLPYFIAAYANRKAAQPREKMKTEEQVRIEQLEQQLRQAQGLIQSQRTVLRRKPAVPALLIRPTKRVDDLGDEDLPEWTEGGRNVR